jgi:hypothetical protein
MQKPQLFFLVLVYLITCSVEAFACKGCHCSVPEHYLQVCYSPSGMQCDVDLHRGALSTSCKTPDWQTVACGNCGPHYQDMYVPIPSDSCYVAKNHDDKNSDKLIATKSDPNSPTCDSAATDPVASKVDHTDRDVKPGANINHQ